MSKALDFKISSGLKNIIGKELITSDRIAIFELVKNSYDANANDVKIVFQEIVPHSKSSKILIIDNGSGMSEAELENKWLFVGYSEKKNQANELNQQDYRNKMKKRIFAGAKGVGRFSCDRLGSKLRIYTKKKSEKAIHCLEVDWSQFEEDQEKEFQTIDVAYSIVPRVSIEGYSVRDFDKGTILEIYNLNDKWDAEKIIDLKKFLQRLVNPSQSEKEKDFSIHLEAKEFLESDKKLKAEEDYNRINGQIKNVVFEKLDIKTTHIKCHVSGNKIHTELIDKGKFIFSLEEKNDYKDLDQIDISVFYLNSSAKNSFTRIMGVEPKNYGSIFLYKNSFRIHPYGDEGNDWLSLETRKTQGYSRYLASRELLGRIELYGEQPHFKEVSSRDGGVLKSTAYDQLHRLFIEKILRRLEKYVIEGINWDNADEPKTIDEINRDSLDLIQKLAGQIKDPDKNIKFNPGLLSIFKEKQIEKLPEVIKNVEFLKKYVKTDEEKKYIDRQISSVRIATKDLKIEKEQKEKELKQEKTKNLYLLSTAKHTTPEVLGLIHHIELETDNINTKVELLIDELNKGIVDKENIIRNLSEIKFHSDKTLKISKLITRSNFNLEAKVQKADLAGYIREYLHLYKEINESNDQIKTPKIELSGGDFKFEHRFSIVEMTIVLDNLISNSRKAGAKVIKVVLEKKNQGMQLTFSDDGKGVASDIKDNIFDLGITSTNGSGIGLYTIKAILNEMHATVSFLGNGAILKGATFKIIFP